MKKKTNSQGFSLVVVFAIVLVVAAVGLGGWYVWQKSQNKPMQHPNKTTTQTNSNSTSNDTQNDQQADPSEGGEYLVVGEWGLKVTLPKNLRGDISYFVNDKANKDFGGPIRIDFLSKEFSSGSFKCSVVEGNMPRSLVSIYKEVGGEGGETQDPQPFTRIGNTRYYLATTACEEALNNSGSAQDKQLLADLQDAVKNTLQSE